MKGLESLLSLVWMLLCVLVIVLLAYLFTRYVAGRGGFGVIGLGGGNEQFKVLTRLPLGREQSAVLLQAGERYLLLGGDAGADLSAGGVVQPGGPETTNNTVRADAPQLWGGVPHRTPAKEAEVNKQCQMV